MNQDAFNFTLTDNFFNIKQIFKPLVDFSVLNARYNLFKKLESIEQSRRVERFLEFFIYKKLNFITFFVFKLTNFFFVICLKNLEYLYNLINLIFNSLENSITKRKNNFFIICNICVNLLINFLFFKLKTKIIFLINNKLKNLVNIFYRIKIVLYLFIYLFFVKLIFLIKNQIDLTKNYFINFFSFWLKKIGYNIILLFYFVFLQIPRIIFYCIFLLINFFFFFRLRKRTWLAYKLEYKKNVIGRSYRKKKPNINIQQSKQIEHFEFLENLGFFDRFIFKIREFFVLKSIKYKLRFVEDIPFYLFSKKERSMELFRVKKKRYNISRIKKFKRRFKRVVLMKTLVNRKLFKRHKGLVRFLKVSNKLSLILKKVSQFDFVLVLKLFFSLLYVFFFFLISFFLSYFILKEIFIFFPFFIFFFFLKKEFIYFFINKVSKFRLLNFQAFPKSSLFELCFNKSNLFESELIFFKFLKFDLSKLYENQLNDFFNKSGFVNKIFFIWILVFKLSDVFFQNFILKIYIYLLKSSNYLNVKIIKNWFNILLFCCYFYFKFIFIYVFFKIEVIISKVYYNIFFFFKIYLILTEFLFNLILIFFFIVWNFFNIFFEFFIYLYNILLSLLKLFILLDYKQKFFKLLDCVFCLMCIFFVYIFFNLFKMFKSILLTNFLNNRKIGLINIFSLLYTVFFNKNVFKYFSLKKRYKKSLYYRFQRSRKQIPYFRFHANIMKKISIDSRLYHGEGLYRGSNNEKVITRFKGNFGRNRFNDFFWLNDKNKIKMKFNLKKSLPIFGLFFFKNSNKINDIFFKEFIFKRYTMRIIQGTLRGLRINYVRNWLRNYQINLDIINQNKLKVFPFFVRNNWIRLEILKLVLYKYRFISERFFFSKIINFVLGSISLLMFVYLIKIEINFFEKFILLFLLFCINYFIYFYNLFLHKFYSRVLNLYLFKSYEFTFKSVITNIFFLKNKRFLLSFKGFCFMKKLDFILKKETCSFSQFFDIFKFIIYGYIFVYFFKMIFFRLFYLIFFIDKKFEILNNTVILTNLFDLNMNYVLFFVNNFVYKMNLFSEAIILICGLISLFICVLIYYLFFKILFMFCIINNKFFFLLDYIILRPGINLKFNFFKLNFKFSLNLFLKINKNEINLLEKFIYLNLKKYGFKPKINIVNLEKELLLLKNINSLKSTKIIKTDDKN